MKAQRSSWLTQAQAHCAWACGFCGSGRGHSLGKNPLRSTGNWRTSRKRWMVAPSQLTRSLRPGVQMLREHDTVGALERVTALPDRQLTSPCDSAGHRKMSTCLKHLQPRSFPAWRVGPIQARPQIESRFGYADQCASLVPCLFPMEGETSLRQRATSFSSGCVARMAA